MGKEETVKRKRFSLEQIAALLKQAEMGKPVSDLIRHLVVAEQTSTGGSSGMRDWSRTRSGSSNSFRTKTHEGHLALSASASPLAFVLKLILRTTNQRTTLAPQEQWPLMQDPRFPPHSTGVEEMMTRIKTAPADVCVTFQEWI